MAKTRVFLREDDGYRTVISTRHHVYHSDEPIESGGTDTAVSPTEMVMGALGSCIAMTVKMYANRKGWELDIVQVELDFERYSGRDYDDYEGDSQFVHEVRKRIVFEGNLDDDQRARLMEIAGKCPVHRLLSTPTFFKDELATELAAES